MWREGSPLVQFVWMQIQTATNSMEVPLKPKNKTTILPANTTPEHMPIENDNSERYMCPNVHYRNIYKYPEYWSNLNLHQQVNG